MLFCLNTFLSQQHSEKTAGEPECKPYEEEFGKRFVVEVRELLFRLSSELNSNNEPTEGNKEKFNVSINFSFFHDYSIVLNFNAPWQIVSCGNPAATPTCQAFVDGHLCHTTSRAINPGKCAISAILDSCHRPMLFNFDKVAKQQNKLKIENYRIEYWQNVTNCRLFFSQKAQIAAFLWHSHGKQSAKRPKKLSSIFSFFLLNALI